MRRRIETTLKKGIQTLVRSFSPQGLARIQLKVGKVLHDYEALRAEVFCRLDF